MEDIRKAVFFMMTKKIDKERDQMMVFCMDDMVPQDTQTVDKVLYS